MAICFVVLPGSVLQTGNGQVAQNKNKILTTKYLIMKTQNKVLQKMGTILLFILAFACSKEEDTEIDLPPSGEIVITGGQIKVEDFDEFEGEIGIVLSARPLVQKGYSPSQVTINVDANSGNFTETVSLDPFSFMGQLKIPLKGLGEAVKEELTSGVRITPEYKSADGNIIFTEPSFTVSFQSNPTPRVANAITLADTEENLTLNLAEATAYYIQRMNDDGSPDSGAWRHLTAVRYAGVITANASNFNGNEADRIYTFIPIPGEKNTYAIRLQDSGRFVKTSVIIQPIGVFPVIHEAPNLSFLTTFSQVQSAGDYNAYKFRFEKEDSGSYRIKTFNGATIKQAEGYGLTTSSSLNNVTSQERLWRVVSTDIQWKVANIGTSFLEPILPKPQTGFSFNSTLTNCGSGSLSQTVGANVTETRSRTIGWEESLSINTSNTVNVSTTVDVGFEAGFFGVGANYNLSVTAGYEHSRSVTESNSKWGDTMDTVEESLFSERTVTIPSGRASLVYDVFQFYPDTKVNFVQRLRVEGIDSKTGLNLTGEEIKTQFVFNNFNGVITSIEANSIVITLKGTVTLDKVIKTESDVQDVSANCRG